jgi:hypothetical protein
MSSYLLDIAITKLDAPFASERGPARTMGRAYTLPKLGPATDTYTG